jgi:hypothetical protein
VLMGAELNAEIGGYDGQDPGLDQARL